MDATPALAGAAEEAVPPGGRIVVGVDPSRGGREALAYALAAAAAWDAEVEVVTTYPLPLPWAKGIPALVPDPERLYARTERELVDFVDEVRWDPAVAAIPGVAGVATSILVSEGPAGAVLLERSADADLLVVGSRARGAVHTALLGSVAQHCVMRASCPVVVVHRDRPRPVPEQAVVVGIDGSDDSRAALVAALVEGRRRGVPVEVVAAYESRDAWTHLYAFVPPGFDGIRADVERGARAMVDEVTATVLGTDGGPEVRLSVVEGPACEVLVERAGSTALLVVGSRGHGGVRGLLLGSVALRCLVGATSPVMVVRHDRRLRTDRPMELVHADALSG